MDPSLKKKIDFFRCERDEIPTEIRMCNKSFSCPSKLQYYERKNVTIARPGSRSIRDPTSRNEVSFPPLLAKFSKSEMVQNVTYNV